MGRYNKVVKQPLAGPIVSTPDPLTRTGNNAPGFTRDAKSELFLLAVANFGSDKFYETGKQADQRFVSLIKEVAATDSGWMKRFLPWLRNDANMRMASMVGAVEAARVWVQTKMPGGRQVVNAVLQRADEPGEMLAYLFHSQQGRAIPKPIKRGIADAARRLYTEYNTLKWDTESHAVRFGDVLELTHAAPAAWYQNHLFKYLIDRRHKRDDIPSQLRTISRNNWVRLEAQEGNFASLIDPEKVREAGLTWEDVLSLVGSKVDKKHLWEALIPNMGYMALLRNLRNFDQAGISDEVGGMVMARLANPEQVAKSRQFPMRFLSAYRAVADNLRWAWPLEQALEHSLVNVPEFKGRTLILIDTSQSMDQAFSKDSELRFWDAATIFGLAVAKRCESADVVSFSSTTMPFPFSRDASLLKGLERFKNGGYFLNGGTATQRAVQTHYKGHDRVLILTDEQADYHGYRDVAASVPADKMVITFNLAGYRVGHAPSGSATRVTMGGLTDWAFKLLPILEQRAQGGWPF